MALSVIDEPSRGEDRRRASFEAEALVHLDSLYRVALRFVRNAADADDLVQDTLFRAYRSWDQFEPGTNARGWLVTILRHLFINDYRRSAWRRRLLDEQFEPEPGHATLRVLEDLVDDEVLHAVDALPLPFREVVTLRDVEELRYEEIAAIVGVPVGTVKSRLFRARSMLQQRLRRYAISAGVISDRGSSRKALEPASLLRNANGVQPVARAEFADRVR
jgi:RNA polymerase sigma-70 factor, ECF subfamily